MITNAIYWRPPGNRTPTADEIAACLPFVLRHIALVRPKVLVLAGGTAARALLPPGPGITRLRGRWFDLAIPGLDRPVPTLPMFHPSFLLRAPERKREAWRDLLALRARLDELLRAGTAARLAATRRPGYLAGVVKGSVAMPGRLDQTRPFLPVNIALLTVSDTRDAAQDRSGDTLAELATGAGHHVAARRIVRDEQDAIVAQLAGVDRRPARSMS